MKGKTSHVLLLMGSWIAKYGLVIDLFSEERSIDRQ